MFTAFKQKATFVAANVGVMIVLHGNSKQFWPQIPYFSLRNETVPEHMRLIFNTLLFVTVGQLATNTLNREHLAARSVSMGIMPLLLPILIGVGNNQLRLKKTQARTFHLSLVLLLPLVSAVLEDVLVGLMKNDT